MVDIQTMTSVLLITEFGAAGVRDWFLTEASL